MKKVSIFLFAAALLVATPCVNAGGWGGCHGGGCYRGGWGGCYRGGCGWGGCYGGCGYYGCGWGG
ncbi:MAG TPA: hypothetical protein VMU04_21790, partial [Candidatus Acidoferrum sp.]|nr:hypothetical protein [Candidatus Acidoferrum sp.]